MQNTVELLREPEPFLDSDEDQINELSLQNIVSTPEAKSAEIKLGITLKQLYDATIATYATLQETIAGIPTIIGTLLLQKARNQIYVNLTEYEIRVVMGYLLLSFLDTRELSSEKSKEEIRIVMRDQINSNSAFAVATNVSEDFLKKFPFDIPFLDIYKIYCSRIKNYITEFIDSLLNLPNHIRGDDSHKHLYVLIEGAIEGKSNEYFNQLMNSTSFDATDLENGFIDRVSHIFSHVVMDFHLYLYFKYGDRLDDGNPFSTFEVNILETQLKDILKQIIEKLFTTDEHQKHAYIVAIIFYLLRPNFIKDPKNKEEHTNNKVLKILDFFCKKIELLNNDENPQQKVEDIIKSFVQILQLRTEKYGVNKEEYLKAVMRIIDYKIPYNGVLLDQIADYDPEDISRISNIFERILAIYNASLNNADYLIEFAIVNEKGLLDLLIEIRQNSLLVPREA